MHACASTFWRRVKISRVTFGGVLNNVLAMEAERHLQPMEVDENEAENENASYQGNNEDEEVASELVSY